VATGNARRDAARRRLEQQLAQRKDPGDGRRRRILIATAALLAVAAVVVIAVVASSGNSNSGKTGGSAGATSGPCRYAAAGPGTNPALRDVGLPPDPSPSPRKTEVVDFATNRGLIEASLDGTTAPCNVQAVTYLIQRKFYDNTPCPRVVNGGIFVVQCGSGTDTTAGGPTFTVPDENLAQADYTAGTIAMANTGQPNTAASQFFFVTKDSNTGLQKKYTVIGHVTKGLDILQQVAAGGSDDSAGAAGGGTPKLPLRFAAVKIVSSG
jgi:peptidyl-prolyl cis-trans isomerase B (cyclophilin B)